MGVRSALSVGAIVATLVTGACSAQPSDRVVVEDGTLPPGLTVATTTTTVATSSGPAAIDATSTVTTAGIGPVKFGTTVSEAEHAAGTTFEPVSGSSGACHRLAPASGPDGLQFLVSDDTVVGLVVERGPVSTKSGAGIGDTLDQLRKLFGSQIEVRGDTATFVPQDPSDAGTRIIFELQNGKVSSYRAGKTPEVDSGC